VIVHRWSLVFYFLHLTPFSILNVQMGFLFLSWKMPKYLMIWVSLASVLCPLGKSFRNLRKRVDKEKESDEVTVLICP
jgi:hypothetical protein